MTDTTNTFEKMMRFPMIPLPNEQNRKLCSENAWDDSFNNISRVELDRKQVALSWHRIILYDNSKQAVIKESQNENYSFKMWITRLPDSKLVTSCRNILFISTFKYFCNIASTKHDFQNKVITTSTATSIFPDIGKGEKRSEN
jgi:hypothetical protein